VPAEARRDRWARAAAPACRQPGVGAGCVLLGGTGKVHTGITVISFWMVLICNIILVKLHFGTVIVFFFPAYMLHPLVIPFAFAAKRRVVNG